MECVRVRTLSLKPFGDDTEILDISQSPSLSFCPRHAATALAAYLHTPLQSHQHEHDDQLILMEGGGMYMVNTTTGMHAPVRF
jgi:hypothetical protein